MNPSKIRERKCSTCKHYQPSPLWRKGWCRNSLLYDRNTNHLVEADSLACNRTFIDYWEPIVGPVPTQMASSNGNGKPRIAPSIPMDTLDAKGNRVTRTGITPMAGMTAIAPDLHGIGNGTAAELDASAMNEAGVADAQHTLEFSQVDPPVATDADFTVEPLDEEVTPKSRTQATRKNAKQPQKPIVFGMGRDRLVLFGLILVIAAAVLGGGAWLATHNTVTPKPVALPTATLAPLPSPTGFGDPTATVPPPPTATLAPVPPSDVIGVNGWVKATQNVTIRDAASTAGKKLGLLNTDKTAHVIDGPVEANNYTWWKVDNYDPNNPTASGWCAGQFLSPIPAP